jgi:short subunit dehydrogenase-like uncharacterized protein
MREFDVIVYGSYGYTGSLIIDELRKTSLTVLLSGRDNDKLVKQSQSSGYKSSCVDLRDSEELIHLLRRGRLVIHCAGPFQHTAQLMAEACLHTRTHYTDITGEYQVFEMLSAYDEQANRAGIVIMPGTGFDVVPSDCLALHLKRRLPSATKLQLAFAMAGGGLSRGTSRTMVEGLGQGSILRKDGKLVEVPLGRDVIDVNFGAFRTNAMCIPWGDVSTAWRSTSIPNIAVYTGVPGKAIRMARVGSYFGWLLRTNAVKNYLRKKIDAGAAGPAEEKRNKSRSYLWGRVVDANGNIAESRLETINGYALTARTSVLIAQRLINEKHRAGYYTPAQFFGEDFILQIESTRREDIA